MVSCSQLERAPERVGVPLCVEGRRDEGRTVGQGFWAMEEQATAPAANEIEQIWFDYKSDPSNYELRNALIERYMPIVRRRAERIRAKLPNEIELDDLISAGSFGLIDAVSAYDPGRGVKFETFCIPRVQGSMLDELRSLDWAPRMVRSKATKLNEVRAPSVRRGVGGVPRTTARRSAQNDRRLAPRQRRQLG